MSLPNWTPTSSRISRSGNTNTLIACVSVSSLPLLHVSLMRRIALLTVLNTTVLPYECMMRSAIPAARCVLPVPGVPTNTAERPLFVPRRNDSA